jgi:catechol 2,3-dioxygenase-like lactoylglutathione lyase family enzyme
MPMSAPRLSLTAVNLGSPEPISLAEFYRQLLGWKITEADPTWVKLVPPDGGVGLAFQREEGYVRPTWPAEPGEQQMMMHLEIQVDDLDSSVQLAVAAGATVAAFQPQEDVRVCLDPDGHPFCLYLPE